MASPPSSVQGTEPLSRPSVLSSNWRLDQAYYDDASIHSEMREWDVVTLSERQVKWQLAEHARLLQDQEHSFQAHARNSKGESTGAATLTSLATAEVLKLLITSDDFLNDVRMVAQSINSLAVRHLLREPRTPYLILRGMLASPFVDESIKVAIDIDEAVLANDRFIRSRGYERNRDGWGLVKLEDAHILFDKQIDSESNCPIVITRKDPPKGGLQVLDSRRARRLSIQPNTNTFIATFDRITKSILRGLDWNHVFVGGGMVLTTLLHTDPAKDNEKKIRDCDIDIYIHGLDPTQANEKVREIFRVWKSNLPSDNSQTLVVKNAKTISFLSDYPNRRVQIVLKLVSSPTEALLNFDLDACALGFNGTDVLMLPRCARALETGYSTFTCDLVWGHALGDRRASQDERLFKYADRGFGVRILPSYIRGVEEQADDILAEPSPSDDPASDHLRSKSFTDVLPHRRPSGKEPGLKTLKRIMALGIDFVHRFYFGLTKLSEKGDWTDPDEWNESLETMPRAETVREQIQKQIKAGGNVEVPYIELGALDQRMMQRSLPRRRGGLGSFELWMRHCEAWRLDAIGEAVLDRKSSASTEYDMEGYDDLPSYSWGESFNVDAFAQEIEQYNDSLFSVLRLAICNRIGVFRQTGWRDYLTRRIRRVVHGPDIESVLEKQITLPVIIPYDLESTFEDMFSSVGQDADHSSIKSQDRLLIPVHTSGRGTTIIPDLREEPGLNGNIRYWVIGNEIMWSGIDRKIDEMFEVLWTFFHWGTTAPSRPHSFSHLSAPDHVWFFVNRYRDRLALSVDLECSSAREGTRFGGPSRREAILFAAWALHRPVDTDYESSLNYNQRDGVADTFSDAIKYPPPEDMFWGPEDETSDSGQWVDVVATDGH
ncbi:MAG: hypothetical protein M4579_002140 [Chaenotheca gracillima]|nr:MAG: hypothetical protein M4579_002140 [Chaenotheca gracillima]